MAGLSENKRQQLEAVLQQVRGGNADSLVGALEMDRLSGSEDLPHATLIEAIRPALRERGQVQRIPTPQRLFCSSFEDLLTSSERSEKVRGRIHRSSIEPFWRWLQNEIVPELSDENLSVAREHLLNGADEEARALILELQTKAGEEVTECLGNDEKFQELCRELGDDVVEDFRDMAACLKIAEDIFQVQSSFEKPVPVLTAEDLQSIEQIFNAMAENSPENAVDLLYVLMSRFSRPWEIFAVLTVLEQNLETGALKIEGLEQVISLLLQDLCDASEHLAKANLEVCDLEELQGNLEFFSRFMSGLFGASERENAIVTKPQIVLAGKAGITAVNKIIREVPEMTFEAFSGVREGVFGEDTPVHPDLSVDPDEAALERSKLLALVFSTCKSFSRLVSLADVYDQASDRFALYYNRHKDGLFAELASADGEARGRALMLLGCLADIAKEVVGRSEARSLRNSVSEGAGPDEAADDVEASAETEASVETDSDHQEQCA